MIQIGAFADGKTTAGYRAKRVKHNEQLSNADPALKQLIIEGLTRHPEFKRAAFAKSIRPPLFSRYQSEMTYGWHVDNALMGSPRQSRSDISVTVFLNGPDEYQGGELEIRSDLGAQEVKLPAGAAVLYPSNSVHRVAPVTEGERLVAVTWIESLVRDPVKREILYDLGRVSSFLDKSAPGAPETEQAQKSYANLLRLWVET